MTFEKKKQILKIIIVILLIVFIILFISTRSKLGNLSESPLKNYSLSYNNLDGALNSGDETIFIFSYTGDKNVHNNEAEIASEIKSYNLQDNIKYVDITQYKDNSNFINELNTKFSLNENYSIKKLPAIIYYANGAAVYTIDSSEVLINSGSIAQIADMYFTKEE